MKKYKMTFIVSYQETIYVEAESEADAQALLDAPDDDFNFKVVTNLKYEADLLSVLEVSK